MCLGVHTQRGSFGTTFRVGRVVDSGTQAKKGERCATRTSFVTRRWTVDGDSFEQCVEDMILDLTTKEPLGACQWVYLGGRMAQLYKGDPEVYIADLEGNLVSVCYLTPDNHLATMVHERARDDQNWWTTKLLRKF